MKNILKKLAIFLLVTPIIFSSCKEDDIDVNVKLGKNSRPYEIAIPISRIDISMEKWIESLVGDVAFIHWTGADKLLEIEYKHSETIEWQNMKKEAGVATFDLKERIFKFGIFDDLQISEHFAFSNIRYSITGNNKIAAPFNVSIANIRMSKDDDYKQAGFNNYLKPNGQNAIDFLVSNTTVNRELTSSNSNILDMGTNCYPDKFVFDLSGMANYTGSPFGDLKIDMSLFFPMEFSVERYERKDTIDFDMKDILSDNIDLAESLEVMNLYLEIKNRFPFDVKFKAYVIDENNKIVDYLVGEENKEDTLVGMGVPNTQAGKITVPTENKYTITIKGEQITKYFNENVKNIILQTMSSSYKAKEGGSVKIFDDTGMYVKIMMDAKVKIPGNVSTL